MKKEKELVHFSFEQLRKDLRMVGYGKEHIDKIIESIKKNKDKTIIIMED